MPTVVHEIPGPRTYQVGCPSPLSTSPLHPSLSPLHPSLSPLPSPLDPPFRGEGWRGPGGGGIHRLPDHQLTTTSRHSQCVSVSLTVNICTPALGMYRDGWGGQGGLFLPHCFQCGNIYRTENSAVRTDPPLTPSLYLHKAGVQMLTVRETDTH